MHNVTEILINHELHFEESFNSVTSREWKVWELIPHTLPFGWFFPVNLKISILWVSWWEMSLVWHT